MKIYLDASSEERARRRLLDAAHSGSRDVAQVASELAARDQSDRTRAVAPLAVAPDAHVIDTTGVPVEEVVARVLALRQGREGQGAGSRRCQLQRLASAQPGLRRSRRPPLVDSIPITVVKCSAYRHRAIRNLSPPVL